MTRLFTIAAVVLAAAAGWFWWSQQTTQPGVSLGSLSAQEAAEVDTSMVEEMRLGEATAPVTIVEYASFTCPHCRAFHDEVFPQLKAEYIDTGNVQLVYREVFFDRFGLWAALVARCADPARYFAMVDLLYDGQKEWIADGQPATIADNLRKLGRTAGLTDEELNACFADEAMAKALVASFQQNAAADGIDSTPTFVIDGEKVTNRPWPELKAMIDEALAG